MPTTAQNTFNLNRLIPIYDDPDPVTLAVNLPANVHYLPGTVLGELIGNNAVHTLTITATGGTFKLTLGGQQTAAIAFNATAAQQEAALELLSTVGEGNVTVTGTGPFVYTYVGALGDQVVALPTIDTSLLTGGTASFANTTAGSAGTRGTYSAYNGDNTDGTQIPKGFLEYECATDGSGNITLGAVAGAGQFGQTWLTAPMFVAGAFRTKDLVLIGASGGLDDNAVKVLGGHLVSGSVADGVYIF